ncbi:glycosyltransferase [Blastococcus montanus]|uniref:glycosyltransferase n=1 Tax=Blastococcus montanus TaxID=3144973 RepID=UPI0032085332
MTVLLACSGGGHLKQLHELVPRLGIEGLPRLWVTFDGGLSRSLLADEDVVYARHAVPRDAANILRNAVQAAGLLRRRRFSMAVSTGASPAVSYLVQTALRGVPSHYIETAARADGPSLTGRIMARTPGVRTYTQYPAWASDGWSYGGSVFDAYRSDSPTPRATIRSAVVSLGTAESFGFRRLVEQLVPLLDGCEVTWQTGATDVTGLPVAGREQVPHHELAAAVAEADVVISHAGTGAAITALEQGKKPLLVPRRVAHGEHVDDHQTQIAGELARRGLAVHREAEDVDHAALLEAASGRTARIPAPPPFRLRPGR